jgi:ribose 5-phosphate isomerase A
MNAVPPEIERVARKALEFVPVGAVLGLGTGQAAAAFMHALGQSNRNVRGLPTSQASEALARQLGIALTSFDDVAQLDLAFDGADEVDPSGNLIKGYGGALVREKIVATASKQFVVLVGPEKVVAKLGERGKLPVEIVPFAVAPCRRTLPGLGCEPVLRMHGDRPFVTDNGNYILDCKIGPIARPREFEADLRKIPGVVGTGLFLNMASVILIGHADSVEERRPLAPREEAAAPAPKH